MGDELLTIGELAERTGLATSALRYYEDLGLVRPTARVSGRRRYEPGAATTVGTILFLRDVGFTLEEVKELMAGRLRDAGGWRELAARKIDELDARIAHATAARTAIEHSMHCPHDDVTECPKFQGVVRDRLAGRRLADLMPSS